MSPKWLDTQVDSVIGPSHHYGGLGHGNLASQAHKNEFSNPRAAALQGLQKCQEIIARDIPQVFLPPPFPAQVPKVIERADEELSHWIYANHLSASYMWTANLGNYTPSCDAKDKCAYFTPANLCSHYHRFLESPFRMQQLRALFASTKIIIKSALPPTFSTSDEGAANHTRLCPPQELHKGVHLFVWGYKHNPADAKTQTHSPRQSYWAHKWLISQHCLDKDHVLLAQQSSDAIDAGAFHNDVVSVGHANFFLCHQKSFVQQDQTLQELKTLFTRRSGEKLLIREITQDELSLSEAVRTYLFNSQFCLKRNSSSLLMICPIECLHHDKAYQITQDLLHNPAYPIDEILYLDLSQSMHGGGGPACLRLRLLLKDEEFCKIDPRFVLDQAKLKQIKDLVSHLWPSELSPHNLSAQTYWQSVEILKVFYRELGLQELVPTLREE